MAKKQSPPARGRIGAMKSRSGCTTCKIRKVKCGEEKPSCLRCTSTGRKCDYESGAISTPSPPQSLIPTLSSSPNSARRERRAFEYYFQHAAQYLSGGMNIDFWTSVVPQICRTEPAVWDAIITISTLFEYPDQSLDFTFLRLGQKRSHALNQTQKDALGWYSRSISTIHSQIEHGRADPYVALISCVMFICVEAIQGRVEEALQLLRQGFTLIPDLRMKINLAAVSATKAALLEDTIIPIFLRLNTIALAISGTQASDLFSFTEGKENKFTSLAPARQGIITLAAEGMLFQREAELHLEAVGGEANVSQEFLIRQNDLKSRLANWLHAYTELCTTLCQNPSHLAYTEPTLLVYHAAASIFVACSLTQHETIYDAYLLDFRCIIDNSILVLNTLLRPNGAPSPFTFEMGVGLPLYLTATKCRHPILRRRALQLLQQAPPVQGFYKCPPGIALAGHLMALEESYASTLVPIMDQNHAPKDAGAICSRNTLLSNNQNEEPIQLSTVIPEEARIYRAGVFRLRDGIPYDVSEEDVTKWNRGPDQLFVSTRRLRRNSLTGTWETVYECAPMEF
ncbi:hypothetical protein N7457_009621 [Penicillium paradoxum]|uniref:uncharacterized protein n=1 Tax=Penicillium paradoxum TaxID=176176 RepID=UPI002548C457|nr:uncharacterized protein N7457_009621 [Penicillium paradoxum]KAJ5774725.1 hypothetical protein N7457_009621 [Penicillium paradoxum]